MAWGIDLAAPLPAVAAAGLQSYGATTWSAWLVAASLLWAPFWFNPQSFQLERCKADYETWGCWMHDCKDGQTGSTW